MPHTCTRCNSIFDSGEDILKGCPVCGWKKFMFSHERPKQEKNDEDGHIITKAMGVRVPPGRKTAIEDQDQKDLVLDSAQNNAIVFDKQIKNVQGAEKKSEKDGNIVESIKITAPGTYELNLPTLLEREELVMAVKEGTYFIDLSSAFKKNKKD